MAECSTALEDYETANDSDSDEGSEYDTCSAGEENDDCSDNDTNDEGDESEDDDDDNDKLPQEAEDDDLDISLDDDDEENSNSSQCPVCLMSLKGQQLGTPNSCDHVFCFLCICEWSKNSNTCPVDRKKFEEILVHTTKKGPILKRVKVEDKQVPNDQEWEQAPTYCEICDQCNREAMMLLCDGCDRGYHMFCLTPRLYEVPAGDWYCDLCLVIRNEASLDDTPPVADLIDPPTVLQDDITPPSSSNRGASSSTRVQDGSRRRSGSRVSSSRKSTSVRSRRKRKRGPPKKRTNIKGRSTSTGVKRKRKTKKTTKKKPNKKPKKSPKKKRKTEESESDYQFPFMPRRSKDRTRTLVSSTALSIFGNEFALHDFEAEEEEKQDEMPVTSPSPNPRTSDVLSSIIDEIEVLHDDEARVSRDGSVVPSESRDQKASPKKASNSPETTSISLPKANSSIEQEISALKRQCSASPDETDSKIKSKRVSFIDLEEENKQKVCSREQTRDLSHDSMDYPNDNTRDLSRVSGDCSQLEHSRRQPQFSRDSSDCPRDQKQFSRRNAKFSQGSNSSARHQQQLLRVHNRCISHVQKRVSEDFNLHDQSQYRPRDLREYLDSRSRSRRPDLQHSNKSRNFDQGNFSSLPMHLRERLEYSRAHSRNQFSDHPRTQVFDNRRNQPLGRSGGQSRAHLYDIQSPVSQQVRMNENSNTTYRSNSDIYRGNDTAESKEPCVSRENKQLKSTTVHDNPQFPSKQCTSLTDIYRQSGMQDSSKGDNHHSNNFTRYRIPRMSSMVTTTENNADRHEHLPILNHSNTSSSMNTETSTASTVSDITQSFPSSHMGYPSSSDASKSLNVTSKSEVSKHPYLSSRFCSRLPPEVSVQTLTSEKNNTSPCSLSTRFDNTFQTKVPMVTGSSGSDVIQRQPLSSRFGSSSSSEVPVATVITVKGEVNTSQSLSSRFSTSAGSTVVSTTTGTDRSRVIELEDKGKGLKVNVITERPKAPTIPSLPQNPLHPTLPRLKSIKSGDCQSSRPKLKGLASSNDKRSYVTLNNSDHSGDNYRQNLAIIDMLRARRSTLKAEIKKENAKLEAESNECVSGGYSAMPATFEPPAGCQSNKHGNFHRPKLSSLLGMSSNKGSLPVAIVRPSRAEDIETVVSASFDVKFETPPVATSFEDVGISVGESERLENRRKGIARLQRLTKIKDTVRLVLQPFYDHLEISRTEFKDIFTRAVQKVNESSCDVNYLRIADLVKKYVKKYKGLRTQQEHPTIEIS